MAESEKLRIEVDFMTAEALRNARALLDLMDKITQRADGFKQIRAGVDGVGEAAKSTTTNLQGVGDAAREAARRVEKLGDDGERHVAKLTTATQQAGNAAERMIGFITAWGASYLGLSGALAVIDRMGESMQKVLDMQGRLAEGKWTEDKALRTIMKNVPTLGMGQQGLDSARAMLYRIQAAAPLDARRATEIISTMQAGGLDVATEQGFGAAEEMAKFSATFDLDAGAIDALNGFAIQRGVKDRDGMRAMLSQWYQLYTRNRTTDMANLVRGALAGVGGPAAMAGWSPEETSQIMAMFGTATTLGRSVQAGSDMTRMVFDAVRTPKAIPFLAREASRLGMTNVAPLGREEFEAAVAAQADPDARRVHDGRQELERIDARISLLRRGGRDRDSFAQQVRELQQQRERKARDLATAEDKLYGELMTGRETEAYLGLTPTAQVNVAGRLFSAARSDEERARLRLALGGQPRRQSAIERLFSPEAIEMTAGNLAALRTARPQDLAQRYTENEELAVTRGERLKNQEQKAQVAAVDDGIEYTQQLRGVAEKRRESAVARGDYETPGWTPLSIELWRSETQQRAMHEYDALLLDMRQTLEGMSADEQWRWKDLVATLRRMIHELDNVGFGVFGSTNRTTVARFARPFGELKSELERRRAGLRAAGRPIGKSVPVGGMTTVPPRPLGSPAESSAPAEPAAPATAFSPQSSAAPGTVEQHIHVGNLWTVPGPDDSPYNLPGPLG